MKNVLVVLAFMLVSSFGFASSGEKEVLGAETESNFFSSVDLEPNNVEDLEGDSGSETSKEEVENCTVKGKFTFTDDKNQSYTWEGSITFVGVSCSELLMQLISR